MNTAQKEPLVFNPCRSVKSVVEISAFLRLRRSRARLLEDREIISVKTLEHGFIFLSAIFPPFGLRLRLTGTYAGKVTCPPETETGRSDLFARLREADATSLGKKAPNDGKKLVHAVIIFMPLTSI